MIERHVTFRVLEGKEAEFESFLDKHYAPALARRAGFRGSSLLRELDASRRYRLILRFEDNGAAEAWRGSEEHKALSPALKSFHAGSEVQVYAVLMDRG